MGKRIFFVLSILVIALLAACSNLDEEVLNPDKPITVTVWHYYNGNTKVAFDNLVREFNETIGMEKGIVIDAQSQGDVSQLAIAVFDAANESIGAAPMPHIFASYPDNAFRVHQIVPLVSLAEYFTEDELSEYRQEFLEEGRFITDGRYYIVPIAKSSENLYINRNQWEAFATLYGYSNEDLSTWEGLYNVSKSYYETTGKSFFSLDANANFMIVTAMQLGDELFTYTHDGKAAFNMTREVAKKIWDYYYIPYINQFYLKTGRFSSDDAKTGSVLTYTGSTAGAAYFPSVIVSDEEEEQQIDPLVLPYPHYKDGKEVSIQQGAGMCVTKSDYAHEYAASLFLKWFTDTEQNLKFAVSTGYFPVKNEALDGSLILEQVENQDITSEAIVESIKASSIMFEEYTLYNSKPFIGSYEIRVLLETHLFNKISNDLDYIDDRVANGDDRHTLIMELTSDDAFEEWFLEINKAAQLILTQD